MFILTSDMLSTCIHIIWTPFKWRWNYTVHGLLYMGDEICVFLHNELEVNMCLFQSESYMYHQ